MRSGKTEMIDFVENLFFILIETICCCLYFPNVFKISVYKENTNLAIYWADRVYDGGNLSFCNNSFLENANSLVFICGIDVWNVSNEIFRSIGNGSLVLCPSSGCGCIGICL